MGKIYLVKCCRNSDFDWSETVIDDVDEIYKIGFTRGNPKKRLKALQTGNPHNMEILEQFETKFNTKLEANLHQIFKSKKIKNEWFLLESEDVDNFIDTCETIEERYTFMSENNYHFRKLLKIK
jgi:uncharacterized Zn-finger protein